MGLPISQGLVAAESIAILSLRPASATKWLKIASAIGERQMLPKQTNITLTINISFLRL